MQTSACIMYASTTNSHQVMAYQTQGVIVYCFPVINTAESKI